MCFRETAAFCAAERKSGDTGTASPENSGTTAGTRLAGTDTGNGHLAKIKKYRSQLPDRDHRNKGETAMQILSKITSSLEKCFLTDPIGKFPEIREISMLENEHLSLQLVTAGYPDTTDRLTFRAKLRLRITGDAAPFVTVRVVEQVPNTFPVYGDARDKDANYLSYEPGLYPDLLRPLHYGGDCVQVVLGQLRTYWIDVEPDGGLPAGLHPLTFTIYYETKDGEGNQKEVVVSENTVNITVIGARLPAPGMYVTQWFHCDSLAHWYHVDVFSEKHWEIIENFVRTAVKNGINLLLTPVFTPPLDTEIGGERLTVQLVGVTKNGGEYSFDYTLLDRWIEMCNRTGIKYLEISHLFTQWGAGHAPKIMATVDGTYQKIFGWETDATGDDYPVFLCAFLSDFLAHMKARGDDKRCLFHVSDEPSEEHLPQYRKSKAIVEDLLSDYIIMDALSDFSFYKEGVVRTPIPANSAIQPFIDAGVKDLWTYYCCGQYLGVSNRLIAMPSWRNRFIGTQFYVYNIKGFLQWGYNFYNNDKSVDSINPFIDICGENWVPGGDCASVYPASDGTALESLRLIVFHEALEDYAAMQLAESLVGRDRVLAVIRETVGEVKFDHCVENAHDLLALREKIDRIIAEAVLPSH